MFSLLLVGVLEACVAIVHGNLGAAIPEDTYAFPKYRIAFLNHFPVSNETAQKWLNEGLEGGELEFLGQWQGRGRPAIASSETSSTLQEEQTQSPDQPSHDSQGSDSDSPTLERMRLGPSKSYLCLIPPAPSLPPPAEESQAPITPSHSWSLLQPLSGTCLYHRQAWFTYSYCHNLYVRQFRELPVQYPNPSGARTIEEDPEWEAYTLGKSPVAESSADGQLSANDDLALQNNLELARQGAGQRYLVQRWGDGTICDKTGRPREIEIQFHCSMTMMDTVLFVKETRTCEYVLVIHTPRLCGEPGFKSRLEQMPEAAIRCRQIVDDPNVPNSEQGILESNSPHKEKSSRLPPVPPPAQDPSQEGIVAKVRNTLDKTSDRVKMLQRAIEKMLGGGMGGDLAVFDLQAGDEGELYITLDEEGLADILGEDTAVEEETPRRGTGKTLEEALRAAGYDIKGRKVADKNADESGEKKDKKKKDNLKVRDEL